MSHARTHHLMQVLDSLAQFNKTHMHTHTFSVVHIRRKSQMAPLITVLKWRLRHITVISGEIHNDGGKS